MQSKESNSGENLLVRAKILLDALAKEAIHTPESGIDKLAIGVRLNKLRKVTAEISKQYVAPGLTGCVAMTLLKVAACQELAQRFALDYFLKFKEAHVSLIFLHNSKDMEGDNHVFVLVGAINVPESLIIGRGNGSTTITEPKDHLLITDFLKRQHPNAVVVDPLLNCADFVNKGNQELLRYCQQHQITHVTAVRSYVSALNIISMAAEIKNNAQDVVRQVNQATQMMLLLTAKKNATPECLEIIKSIDIHNAILNVVDDHGMTALHYACLYGNQALANALIQAGASLQLLNKKDHTPLDCLGYGKEKIQEALTSVNSGSGKDHTAVVSQVNILTGQVEARVNGIVSNQHRNAYDKAALLTTACTATLKHINPAEATRFFNAIKNKFPRHSAFQSELRQHYVTLDSLATN